MTVEQIAEEERRKKEKEYKSSLGSFNVTKDYSDADTEIRVTSSSSGGEYYSKNHTESWSSSGGSEQRTHYSQQEQQQRIGNQQQENTRIRLEQEQAAERQRQEQVNSQRTSIEYTQREERKRQELIESQRKEAERLRAEQEQRDELQRQQYLTNQRLEAERRRIQQERTDEVERQRLTGIHRAENERQRTEYLARQRLEETRRREEEQRRYGERPGVSETYGVERHWTTDTGNNNRHGGSYGTGTTGEVVTEEHAQNTGLNFGLTNIGSSQDLEKFFSNLNHDSAAITTYTRNGKEYVQFDGRFRFRGDKVFIQFRNGESFELLDRYGDSSYATGERQSEEYRQIEGQLVGGEDGYIYIQLVDGRKFRIPGTYTYERKHTFTVGGSGTPRQTSDGRFSYGRQVTHESSSDGRTFAPYNNWREESYEQKYKSEKKVISGGGGSSFETIGTFKADDVPLPTDIPEQHRPRYRRESDVIEVEQFLRHQKQLMRERDPADMDFGENFDAEEALSRIHRDRRDGEIVNYGSFAGVGNDPKCDAAHCVRLKCTLRALKKGQEVLIRMRYRVKAKTLNEIAFNEEVKVSTKLTARVTRQQYIVGELNDQPETSHEITTLIRPASAVPAPDVVPLWVVVLSACAGTIILLLLIFLLYKVKFYTETYPYGTIEIETHLAQTFPNL